MSEPLLARVGQPGRGQGEPVGDLVPEVRSAQGALAGVVENGAAVATVQADPGHHGVADRFGGNGLARWKTVPKRAVRSLRSIRLAVAAAAYLPSRSGGQVPTIGASGPESAVPVPTARGLIEQAG